MKRIIFLLAAVFGACNPAMALFPICRIGKGRLILLQILQTEPMCRRHRGW